MNIAQNCYISYAKTTQRILIVVTIHAAIHAIIRAMIPVKLVETNAIPNSFVVSQPFQLFSIKIKTN